MLAFRRKERDITSPYPPVNYNTQPQFVSAHSRARLTIALLIAGAIVDVFSLLIIPLEVMFPISDNPEDPIDAAGVLVGLLQLGLGLLTLGLYIATIVVFLMWLYRSYENMPALGVPRNTIQYSSGWAVGSFFIPFVSLVVPYRAVRELWRKSGANASTMFGELSPPAFFPWWWAFWLLSNFANQIYFRLSFSGKIDDSSVHILGGVTAILDIISALFAIQVIKEIDRRQAESAEQIPRSFVSLQPPMPPPDYSRPSV